ncbi:helix-turn-helix protein [Pseudonocardia sediminis]|uniref:Helix-turn-helix protein n=1 Tax=Pseudonocardia sediminis TaxID=1397368 RepID=A0A4Q7UQX1_PSEST|nr:helix-turn-helix transcriptional regulator [Pseudonocardia sediminis]RZT84065.1 helix-turn-helix protein [Pseudonocardia sediminis]
MTDEVDPAPDPRRPGGDGIAYPDPAGLCRAVRRRADASQREMAERTGLSRSTIARIESGKLIPSLSVLNRILVETDLLLVAVDRNGRVVAPMEDPPDDDLRDGAGKRYPSHLDTIVDPEPGEWWASIYGMAHPPETYHRDRERRDVQRARSQWEVRVARLRAAPPPPTVEAWLRRRARQRELREARRRAGWPDQDS